MGPDTKSLTAYDTILKLGLTEEFKKNDIRTDRVNDIVPIIAKYPPLSRRNLYIRFSLRLRIFVSNTISLKNYIDSYVNYTTTFKINLICN